MAHLSHKKDCGISNQKDLLHTHSNIGYVLLIFNFTGSERLLENLANSMEDDPAPYMLSAVQVLPMPSNLRENVSTVIKQNCSKAQNVVFALLIANNRLITLVRMKKYYIHPADLHLIFNFVNSSESFKLSESWAPICLPKFDSRYV